MDPHPDHKPGSPALERYILDLLESGPNDSWSNQDTTLPKARSWRTLATSCSNGSGQGGFMLKLAEKLSE
jgi:hypothetical protein